MDYFVLVSDNSVITIFLLVGKCSKNVRGCAPFIQGSKHLGRGGPFPQEPYCFPWRIEVNMRYVREWRMRNGMICNDFFQLVSKENHQDSSPLKTSSCCWFNVQCFSIEDHETTKLTFPVFMLTTLKYTQIILTTIVFCALLRHKNKGC